MIRARPGLVDEKGNLENHYSRCPKNLTLFQCALFHEDYYACDMLKKHLTQEQLSTQYDELYELLRSYGNRP